MRAYALEGHQRIERGDGTFDSEWRVHGLFRHDDGKFMQEAADAAEFKATLWVSAAETAGEFESNMHHAIARCLAAYSALVKWCVYKSRK